MSILPFVNLPPLYVPSSPEPVDYNKVSPQFDWKSGDFLFDKAGRIKLATPRESFESWAIKVVNTERFTRLCYSDKIGVEFERAMKMTNPDAVKSMIIREISEAILIHPRARAVKNFKFRGEGDQLWVEFVVVARDFETTLTINL